nr:MAG TPA: hypothetical protein [Caudoviricetes sp.]
MPLCGSSAVEYRGIAVMRPKGKLIRYCASRGPVRPGDDWIINL